MSGPNPVADTFTSLIAARAVTTATTLGVFDALAEDGATAADLASRLGLDPMGTEVLTTALVALGYLERDDDLLRNTEVSERLLVRTSPESLATFVGPHSNLHWEILSGLDDAVRTGSPYALHEERWDSPAWDTYMRALFQFTRPDHDATAALIPAEDPRVLVDIAGGHGGFAMAMCRRHPMLRATIVDLPPSAAAGRRIVEEHGFADRIAFREGDVFEVGLGEDADVISFFNLIHHLPDERSRELCAAAAKALRAGGWLVVGDSEPPEAGDPATDPGAISSLLMYATSHGRNVPRDQVVGWFEEAGLHDIAVHRNPRAPWRYVVVGHT